MKKIKLLITFLVWILFSYAYTQNFQFLENINNKFTDIFFSLRGAEKPTQDIIIVDIDEKSLSSINGFNREKLAQIIDNLINANSSIIGLNMTFPREDQNSPKVVLTKLGVDAQNVKDYDEILAKSFKNSMLAANSFDFFPSTGIAIPAS